MIDATLKRRAQSTRARKKVNVRQRTPKESRMKKLSVAVSALALILVASCGVAFATREVVGVGTTGAQYALFLPDNWNGDLVVYVHGFIDPAAPEIGRASCRARV